MSASALCVLDKRCCEQSDMQTTKFNGENEGRRLNVTASNEISWQTTIGENDYWCIRRLRQSSFLGNRGALVRHAGSRGRVVLDRRVMKSAHLQSCMDPIPDAFFRILSWQLFVCRALPARASASTTFVVVEVHKSCRELTAVRQASKAWQSRLEEQRFWTQMQLYPKYHCRT